MAWVYLTVAGLLEIVWAIGLKYTEGFSKLGPTAITVAAMLGSTCRARMRRLLMPIARQASMYGSSFTASVWPRAKRAKIGMV